MIYIYLILDDISYNIFPHFLCPKDPLSPFPNPRRQQRTEANEPEARQVVQLRLLKLPMKRGLQWYIYCIYIYIYILV